MADGRTFFDQPIKNGIKTWKHLKKFNSITTQKSCEGDDYTTGCLLDYNYFKKHNMIAIDLSKQQALSADPNAI